MSPSIVRRLSILLQDMDGAHDWTRFRDQAYAIIRDMRDATPAMVKAGEGRTGAECWSAMIEAALSEEPTEEGAAW